jgi:hypothetical protein
MSFRRVSVLSQLFCVLSVASYSVAFAPSKLWNCKSNAGSTSTCLLLSSSTAALPEGIVKTVTTTGTGRSINLGDIATVKYTCYLPENDNNKPFATATKQKMVRLPEVVIV